MYKAFKYRLYPTKAQQELIHKHIAANRFIYNLALETKITAYQSGEIRLSAFDLMKQLTTLKKDVTWLNEIGTQSLQQSIKNMDSAFKNFFKGSGFPKYKKKSNRGSFCTPQKLRIKNDCLIIPKFGKRGIKINLHRDLYGKLKSVTISVTPTGKFFASILCDTDCVNLNKPQITKENTIGIDLGIKDFLITSDGEVVDNPKYLSKAQSKLKYLQRKYSKHKGKRSQLKVAKLHETVTNKRKDFLHKLSTKLIRKNQTIALETLQVKKMVKNSNLALPISDASWATFVTMLEYKAEWHGVNILRIGKFEPSSKTCSNCSRINDDLKLSDREWTCQGCNTTHDRDVNAAINIKHFALRNNVSGTDTKTQDELPTLVGVLTPEAHVE